MKKSLKKTQLGTMLLLLISSQGCASSYPVSPQTFQSRQFEIAADFPGVIFTYYTCANKFLWICTKKIQQVDKYDFTDPEVRKQFRAASMVVKSRTTIK